jgi:hypothetical protein
MGEEISATFINRKSEGPIDGIDLNGYRRRIARDVRRLRRRQDGDYLSHEIFAGFADGGSERSSLMSMRHDKSLPQIIKLCETS